MARSAVKHIFVAATLLAAVSSSAQEPKNPEWQKPFDAVYSELQNNLQKPCHHNPYFHVHPAPKYPGVYLWDSSFISLVWKNRNLSIAQDVIRSVLYAQRPDGSVPQDVSIFGPEGAGRTNPPVLSYAASRIAEVDNNVEFVKSVYSKLKSFHGWLWQNRRLENGLFFWREPYESGIDNSPRFSNRDESKVDDTTQLAASDFSAYAVLDCESLTKLAGILLRDPQLTAREAEGLLSDIALYAVQAEVLREKMREYLWNDEDGYFYDRNVKTGEFIRIPTVASLIPLLAGVPTYEQWLRLREHIVNPAEFYTPIPIPTVARNSPAFEKDCWRGPVWVNTAYMVILGVKRYGDTALSTQLATMLVDGVYKTWEYTGKYVEFYDPEAYDFRDLTRKAGLGFLGLSASDDPIQVFVQLITKRLILGNKPVDHFIGWTGLVNTLVLDEIEPSENAQ